MGSVKDLAVLKEPAGTETGTGRFIFSDRYSVFDWGEMPDQPSFDTYPRPPLRLHLVSPSTELACEREETQAR